MTTERVIRSCIPCFCLALLLILIIAVTANLLSVTGSYLFGIRQLENHAEQIQNTTDSNKPIHAWRNHGNIEKGQEKPSWSWFDFFSYVPYGVENCTELFQGKGVHTPEFQAKYDVFLEFVGHQRVSEGTSAKYKEEFLAYIQIVQAPFIRTVCETGFNAGHSSFAWLAVNPDTHVYSFDLGSHGYAKPMAKYLIEQFPGRLNVTWGNSKETLPRFRKENPHVRCDLIIIDGGHNFPTCKSDFDNFLEMANRDNIVILDNYPDKRFGFLDQLGPVWERAKREATVAEVFKCHYKDFRQGFSVGRMIPP